VRGEGKVGRKAVTKGRSIFCSVVKRDGDYRLRQERKKKNIHIYI
jgi:hypothetical protein